MESVEGYLILIQDCNEVLIAMNVYINVKPYSEIWFNCKENMLLSLLTTEDERYRDYVINNGYMYVWERYDLKSDNKTLLLHNDRICKLENRIDVKTENIKFDSKEQMFDLIEQELKKKMRLLVGVNLFYWIPDSICWEKHHWYHYSLITGYDRDKQLVYVLDDNKTGYSQFEIPQDRFWMAVYHSEYPMEEKLQRMTYEIKDSFKQFTVRDMLANCENIIECVEYFTDRNLWVMDDIDYQEQYHLDLNILFINQIINQHKANGLLIERLRKENLLENEVYEESKEQHGKVLEGWNRLMVAFGRIYFSVINRKQNLDRANALLRNILNDEKKMWEVIQQAILKKPSDVLDLNLFGNLG